MECWNPVLNRTPEEQIAILGDTDFRAAFVEALKRPLIFSSRWDVMTILEVADSKLARYVGRNVAEIAAERGLIRSIPSSISRLRTGSLCSSTTNCLILMKAAFRN